MSDIEMDELLDGLALWDEHRPRSGEDWLGVAERCLSMPRPDNPSPIFAGLLLAVEQRDALREWLIEFAKRVERDRREPDKLLIDAASMRAIGERIRDV